MSKFASDLALAVREQFFDPTLAGRVGQGRTFWVLKAAGVGYVDFVKEHAAYPDGTAAVYTTVDAAVSACTANRGDTVYVLPDHTETVTSSSISLDVAGVTIINLGAGLKRPTYTYGAAAATINVSAANVSWKGGHFIGNFDDVAAAFTLAAAKDFSLEGGTYADNSSSLHFLSIVVTGATANAADGLRVVGNTWYALALSPNAFISVLGTLHRLTITDNDVNMAATNNVGHFLTLADKNVTQARIRRNVCTVVGATNASAGIFLTGSGTANTGDVSDNRVSSLDTTTELIFTAGTGLTYFDTSTPARQTPPGIWYLQQTPQPSSFCSHSASLRRLGRGRIINSHHLMNFTEHTLLNAVTATTTSAAISVEKYRRIGFQFKRAAHSAGSSAFSVEGTVNGTDWTALSVIVSNATNTNAQNRTRVATVTLSADGTALAWLEDLVVLKAIRVTATETTDGTHSCWMIASE